MASSLAANPALAERSRCSDQLYGKDWRELATCNPTLLVTSFEREVDLVELEQLCDAVG